MNFCLARSFSIAANIQVNRQIYTQAHTQAHTREGHYVYPPYMSLKVLITFSNSVCFDSPVNMVNLPLTRYKYSVCFQRQG